MIPKRIHFCWFGGKEKPKKIRACIDSWYRFCPDYEILEWSEENFDVQKYSFSKYCHAQEKWAFLSDMARLAVVYEHGGFYFDTDVELIRPIEELRNLPAFFGFENSTMVNTGQGFGAEAGNPVVHEMLLPYLNFIGKADEIGTLVPCPRVNTEVLLRLGLVQNGQRQNVPGAEIFPVEYFNPYDDPTGVLSITDHTYSIHWYGKSWLSRTAVFRSKITRIFHRHFGTDCFDWLKGKPKK